MTEKRYVAVEDDRYIYPIFFDNEQDGRELSAEEIMELLNELHEENMMLKGEVAHYKLLLMSLEEQARRLSQIR